MSEQNNHETKDVSERHKKLLKIAAEQGVRPVANFESILGPADGSPEIGTVDEFLAMLRESRREGRDRPIKSSWRWSIQMSFLCSY